MDFRVVLLCIVTVYGKTPEYNPHHKNLGLRSDAKGQSSNVKEGFVQPLDFSSFTHQFEQEQGRQGSSPFGSSKVPPSFGAETKKSGTFQIPNSEFNEFSGSLFPSENKVNKTGFVQPVQFISSFDKDGSNSKVYKTNINPATNNPKANSQDQITRATEDESDEVDAYYKEPTKVHTFRHSTKPKKSENNYSHGKSSYPPSQRKQGSDYYASLLEKPEDVEMILPKDKVLFLPMVNGRPKPYDGYRAAPEAESYESYNRDGAKESSEQRERRLSEGEIIYGKPKIALSPLYHRHLKRSPAEYYGGIYPYYDYSDSKLSVSGETDPDELTRGKKSSATNQKRKKAYPKKHRQRSGNKPYNPYKYPKENVKKRNKEEDSHGFASGESSEEVEDASEEESEETKREKPLYKYTYDNTFSIPQLEIKTYPYEKHLRDNKEEGSRRDESYEIDEDNVDEYTAGYERYIKTLPADLETYFGTPDLDRYSVEATQNLENNKNCKKIDNAPVKNEENSGKEKREAEAGTQICYICSNPETGDNYEQCAYKSQPKSQKYFFGGTTSFQSNDTAEPTTYRYRRSAYDHPEPYLESESAERQKSQESEEDVDEYYKKPKKKTKKKYKKQKASSSNFYGKKYPKSRYESFKNGKYSPFSKLEGAYSTKRGRSANLEEPPRSYDGPKYTYEGPEETYEGPSQPYEGPKETYEGPAEPYEGPINQEYYDTTDERLEDDEEEAPKQEHQGSSPPRSRYYNEQKRSKPKKRQSYSSHFHKPYRAPKYTSEEYQGESFRPHSYVSDYRFGPEHFIDEEDTDGSKHSEQVNTTPVPKVTEKRGPHKFPPPEARSAAATDNQEKEESIGDVKVFKNGDVCQKKRKEGMICMVCKNEKTAATYEQCQYSTKPKEKYYAYGSQKSYTTKNPKVEEQKEEESDQFPEKSDIVEKKILITTQSKVFGDPVPTEGLVVAESNNNPRILLRDASGEYSDSVETLSDDSNQNDTNNRDFVESIERIEPRDGIEGLEEYLYDAEDSEKKATEEEKQSYKSYDDYFHDLFPEFAKSGDPVPYTDEKEESESERHLSFDPFANVRKFHEENSEGPERYSKSEEEEEEEEKDAEASRPEELRLKDKESRIPPDFFLPYNEEHHKKDLEKALGEFQNKDWSNCKKIVKKKLTCYQCVDKNGVNNEECMYVEASQPINKHLAYHEKKELKPASQETKNKTIEPSTEITQAEKPEKEKSLKRFRKAKNSQAELIEVAEPPKEAEYIEQAQSKGDLEGVERLPASEPVTESTADLQASTQASETTTSKPKAKKQKRHPKKRNKTIRNETTTERFEKVRKRKFPVKKFTESEEIPVESKPESGSFGLKSTDVPHVDNSSSINLNETENSSS